MDCPTAAIFADPLGLELVRGAAEVVVATIELVDGTGTDEVVVRTMVVVLGTRPPSFTKAGGT
jgi:hypothetical protein